MRLSFAVMSLLLWTGVSTGIASAEQIEDDEDIIIVAVKPRSADIKPVAIALPAQGVRENVSQNPTLKFGGDNAQDRSENRTDQKTAKNAVLSGL